MSVVPVSGGQVELIINHQIHEYLTKDSLLTVINLVSVLFSPRLRRYLMLDSWAMNIDRSFVKAVVFLDLKRAFHTVDLNILTRKLQYFGMCRSRLNGLLLTQTIELKFV